ncbi:hypothetical protein GCM10017687_06540 [Streptomyces echinatus]
MRRDPFQIAPGAPADVPVAYGLPGALQVGHGGGVDHRGHPGGAGQLVQMAEEAEPGDVGGAFGSGGQRGLGRLPVEGGHGGDGVLEPLSGGLVAVVEDAGAQRFGQGQRQPGPARVVAQQPPGIGDAGDGHAVLGFRVVDAVSAADVAAGLGGGVEAAAQHLAGEVEREPVAWPGEQVDGEDGPAAHSVHVGQGVGGGDPAPVVGVVDDRREEVGRAHQGGAPVGDHGRVVAGGEADEERGVAAGERCRGQPRDHGLQFAGRDLAGAAAAVGELREPYGRLSGRCRGHSGGLLGQ